VRRQKEEKERETSLAYLEGLKERRRVVDNVEEKIKSLEQVEQQLI